ncbi:YkvA family protein [Mesonia sp. MT50]|uniref:YkvA family protein n=1 Tax=Mesonia profundi TaxID=3070998 RepID=A0ABU0ZX47_9FLAO|nr:YkvA family protein [Mesonia profundi]MDQ7916037.1 YkvA family protein [Mesonia profundi]
MGIFNKEKKIDEAYVKKQASKTSREDMDVTISKEEDIEEKIANSGILEKYASLTKLMLKMLKDYKNGLYTEVPWFTIGSIIFSLLYILNPLDLVPDFIPVLGYIDDLSVLTFALKFVETDLHNYLDWKIEEADNT